jgi:hypothetical protein
MNGGFGGIGSGLSSGSGVGGGSSGALYSPPPGQAQAHQAYPGSSSYGFNGPSGPGSGLGSIGRTNGYAVNLNLKPDSGSTSGILAGHTNMNPGSNNPEERFSSLSSLGSRSSGTGSSVFDPDRYARSHSDGSVSISNANQASSGFGVVQGQHPRSRMVFASQTFVPPGSAGIGFGSGSGLVGTQQQGQQQQQQQQQQQVHPMYSQQGSSGFYQQSQQPQQPPPLLSPSLQAQPYPQQTPTNLQQQQRYHNGNAQALGLGGVDEQSRSQPPGILGGTDERSRGRQMSQMEKAIFGSAGASVSGSAPGEVGRSSRMRGRPDTVVDRLLRREEDEDGRDDEDDRDQEEEREHGARDHARGRGQADRPDTQPEPERPGSDQKDSTPNEAGTTNGRNSSRTRTRTRTRSKSKRRGGRSRSDSRNPSSRLGQSRGTSRARGAEGGNGPAGDSDKEDTYGDRDGLGMGRSGKREGLGKKPVEREEISTIFMVGFPDDISVSHRTSVEAASSTKADKETVVLDRHRNASLATFSPSPTGSKPLPLNSPTHPRFFRPRRLRRRH